VKNILVVCILCVVLVCASAAFAEQAQPQLQPQHQAVHVGVFPSAAPAPPKHILKHAVVLNDDLNLKPLPLANLRVKSPVMLGEFPPAWMAPKKPVVKWAPHPEEQLAPWQKPRVHYL